MENVNESTATEDRPDAPVDEPDSPIGTIENIGAQLAEGPEASLRAAADASEAAGKPLQVKISLTLYDPTKQAYIGWRGQAWKASLAHADAARTFRNALAVFFEALGLLGPERLIALLRREMGQAG